MAVSDQAFPRLDTQAIDPKTGRITQPWYRFFIALWQRSGGGAGFDITEIAAEAQAALYSDLMGEPADPQPFEDSVIFGLMDGEERQGITLPILTLSTSDNDPSDAPVAAVQSVTVGSSPLSYSARAAGNLLVSGGTVSALKITRGGVDTTLPTATAIVPLSPGDAATVTFTGSPTITFIPR